MWREPAGAEAGSVTVRLMLSFDTPGPRRRGGDAAALGCSGAGRSVAVSMPDGFVGGHGGNPFRRRISSFGSWVSRLAEANAAVSFSFSLRSRSTSPISRRTNPISSGGLKVSSKSTTSGATRGLKSSLR